MIRGCQIAVRQSHSSPMPRTFQSPPRPRASAFKTLMIALVKGERVL